MQLFRERFIPKEKINLSKDEILLVTDEVIITRWNALKQREDLSRGVSCYFLQQGIKVSKFFDLNNQFKFWYCDIIKTQYDSDADSYTFSDLLADVIVYGDGRVQVLDIAEIAESLDLGLISIDDAKIALRRLDFLLDKIYSNQFDTFTNYIENIG